MSAVMSTLSMISGGRRSHQKLAKKSSRKSGQYSDFEDRERRNDLKEQRSASLQTLESPSAGGPPRVAHLETLEAKMANIEVSLSTTRQHRRSGGSTGGSTCGISPARVREQPARELDALRTALRDKDSLIQNLKEQLCTTLSINRISASLSRAASPGGTPAISGGTSNGVTPGGLSPEERCMLEERAASTRKDAEEKRNTISTLKQALERLHVTDNIDTRIQQAELEYQLGREELELLTLMEQSRALQLLVEQADAASATNDKQTVYSCVSELPGASILAVEVDYDAKSPRFGAGPRRCAPGIWVDWARDDSGLTTGDRLLEVNGALVVSCKSTEELWRALGITPRGARVVLLRPAQAQTNEITAPSTPHQPQMTLQLRAEIGALRERASESQRAKDGLRADNLRLTHRISYLEEQVAELLARDKQDTEMKLATGKERNCLSTVNKTKKNVTNINITSELTARPSPAKSEVQVFQKGPDITAIVANLPGLEAGAKNTAETSANLPIVRPKSNMSNVSNTHISSPNANRARSVTSVEQSENERCHYSRPSVHRSHRQSLDSYAMQLSKSSHSLDHKCKEKLDYASERRAHKMRQSLSQHCISSKDKTLDYQAETAAALEIIKNNQKLYMDSSLRKELNNDKSHSDDQFTTEYNWDKRNSHSNLDYYNSSRNLSKLDDVKSTDQVVKKTNWAEKKTLSIIEQLKQSQRLRKTKTKNKSVENVNIEFDPERDYVYHRIDGKILENTHKSNRRQHARNVKSLDVDSENSDFPNGDIYNSQKLIDYNSEPGSVKLGFYKKNSHSSVNGDVKVRPMPPKKPLRLSLHRAQSSQSMCTDTCTNASSTSELQQQSGRSNEHSDNYSYGDYSDYGHLATEAKSSEFRKPGKRNYKGDRFVDEQPARTPSHKERTNGTRNICPTPKPTKKLLNGFTSYDTPAADDLYPNTSNSVKSEGVYNHVNGNGSTVYSPRTPSRSESVGSRADSNHSEGIKWPPSTSSKTRNDHYRFNGHLSSGGKWC